MSRMSEISTCLPAEEALRTMSEHRVRRLPVIDGHDLVGMLATADVARHLGKSEGAGAEGGS